MLPQRWHQRRLLRTAPPYRGSALALPLCLRIVEFLGCFVVADLHLCGHDIDNPLLARGRISSATSIGDEVSGDGFLGVLCAMLAGSGLVGIAPLGPLPGSARPGSLAISNSRLAGLSRARRRRSSPKQSAAPSYPGRQPVGAGMSDNLPTARTHLEAGWLVVLCGAKPAPTRHPRTCRPSARVRCRASWWT
jgi:hypothetical protein